MHGSIETGRAALVAGLLIWAAPAGAEAPQPITVIDADTVEQTGIRYRLIDFDAPEIHRAQCAAEREAGIRAAAHLIDLLRERRGNLAVEVNGRGRPMRDKFGRGLARLTIGGVAWSQIAIAAGHAVAWDCKGKQPSWCGSV